MKTTDEELTIVTAFFDVGRGEFSASSRSNDNYLEYFKGWARIRNKLIVYTDAVMAKKVMKVREDFGLKERTHIEIVEDYIDIDRNLYEKMLQVSKDSTFLNFRYCDNTCDNNAKYDFVMLLKAWCISDAVQKKLASGNIAWLDFGFNKGGAVYTDPLEFDFLWSYDFPKDKVTLFSLKEDDHKPIFKVVQSYEVYVMGGYMIVPDHLALTFWNDIKEAMNTLLDVGFLDDDQTLLLMVSRMHSERYNVKKSDWYMPLKENGGKHLSVREKPIVKNSLLDNILYKMRVYKRNKNCGKRLKKIFYKDYLD